MFAITFSPSPAASMTSASIFSVTVGKIPATPRAASRSSPRSGGLSETTVTSKSRRRRSPASGISRVTSTFSGMRLLPLLALIFLSEHLAQHGLQDAAVTEVLDLDRGIHAHLYLELLHFVARDLHGQLLARLEAGETGYVEGLVTRKAEGFCALTLGKLQGQHAHADQVRAVDALEALRDNGPDAEQEGSLGGPVARGARPVFLAGQDDER